MTLKQIIIKGDLFDVVPGLEQTIDCVMTDPPYNTSNTNVKTFKDRANISADFGEWDKFTDEEYLEFTKRWIGAVTPKLKESGNLVTFCKMEYISDIKRICRSLGYGHHATIIWHKTNPVISVRKRSFLSSCEAILWESKGYDESVRYTFNFGKQSEMHNFIETPICMGKERYKHPTQKPRKVIDWLMKIFTNEGDCVLDPFAGTGTVMESCMELGRNSISVEKEDKFVEMIRDRAGKNYGYRLDGGEIEMSGKV